MLCGVVAAVAAFSALPAMASAASPTLTNASGVAVTPHDGQNIKAVSTNLKFITASGNLECTTSTLEGELTVNAGNVVEADISAASFLGDNGASMCTTSFPGPLTAEITVGNLPWCLKATAAPADTVTIDGGTCGTTPRKSIEFTAHLYNSSTTFVTSCTYERASVTAKYKTKETPLVATVAEGQEFAKTAGSILCPAKGTLTGAFTLTKGGGNLSMD
jgi:hypothetical protein